MTTHLVARDGLLDVDALVFSDVVDSVLQCGWNLLSSLGDIHGLNLFLSGLALSSLRDRLTDQGEQQEVDPDYRLTAMAG